MALQLISNTLNLNFMGFRWYAIAFSVISIFITGGLLATKGLNLGVDFAGGALVQIQTPAKADIGQLRQALSAGGLASVTLQAYGNENEVIVRMPAESGSELQEKSNQIKNLMAPVAGEVVVRRVEYVGPQIGEELRRDGVLAVALALLAIMIYVSARFEMRYGVGALVSLFHDVTLTVGVISLLQMEVNMTVLAAILTIIGYSLNDTIVIFDFLREDRRKQKKAPLLNVMNESLNRTLSRTLMTGMTTLVVLLVMYIWGGETLEGFAFTLLLGVVLGTYSSIFVACPTVLLMENYYQRMAAEREKEGKTTA
ncbi:MAG: protein translocase subunit SecF [Alphaproteobacteria bacterium]